MDSVCLSAKGSFMLCFHSLLTIYGAGITTGGVQWVVYVEIDQRVASKSAKNMYAHRPTLHATQHEK